MDAKTKHCWECRRRRLVCDFARPKCRKCQVRGVECPGYGSKKPLKWLQPQQADAKGPEKMVVPRTVKPAVDRHISAVFEAVEYYNVHIAPDLVATGVGGPQNPYWMPPCAVTLLPQSFTQSIVCTSLCHRILQSSDVPPSDQVVLARRFQKHRGDALRALAADLAELDDKKSDLQQSLEPPDWRCHTNGATAMINMKGGLGHLVFSQPNFHLLFRFYALTTSPPVNAESARSQLEMVIMLPVLYGNGLATNFPCPPDLLAEVIRINHLRSVLRGVSAPTDVHSALLKGDKQAAALDILRRIRSCPVDKWAAEVAIGLSSSEDPVGLSGWQAIACIYQSAAAIYCMAALLHDSAEPAADAWLRWDADRHLAPREVLAKARESCCLVLLDRLREVSKCTQLRKQVLWPLFVAGVVAEDEAMRGFIVGELRWISNALGTAAPLVAKDLLENRVWKLGLGTGDWDRLFDQPYVFVL
ncbi:hypothetical protein DL766_009726 [Monosporascus sp. MC13-8B]|uniref:Zn(2)-C6 fungal-type domain-containing protein n=1 Tax=Monosporascus cannonballus TaxID=155416 RepID=A0ABY0H0Q1_9PEZI|nr:hypothetical protein DL762_008371 [Monosporascus cannonballus]RYO99164.1 hypothetical protein DL763_001654 [Monosporascus cannonballus]RYP14257.1 hypothetical protein DL766_009726 [Monosporascus sp. MC13-8B]